MNDSAWFDRIAEALEVAGVAGAITADQLEWPEVWSGAVVAIVTFGDDRLVVKASAKGSGVRGEAIALRLAREAQVPVARVVALVNDSQAPGGAWLVSSFMDGLPGDGAPPSVWIELGRALGRLHRAETRGWGPLGSDGSGTARSWSDWLQAEAEVALRLLPQELRSPVAAAVTRGLAGVTSREARLVHGDINPHELRYVADRLNGLLDFGDAMSADPLYDLAVLATGGPTLTLADRLLPLVLQGYELRDTSELETLMPAYRLVGALRNYRWSSVNHMDDLWMGQLTDTIRSLVAKLAA